MITTNPVLQIILMIGGSFVSEDATLAGAAMLGATGKLPWWVAWLGCVLGIGISDVALYVAGWAFGSRLGRLGFIRRMVARSHVQRGAKFLRDNYFWAIALSRFLPGSRLPTYTAAGALRLPFLPFLLVMGLSVVLWTSVVMVIAAIVGAAIEEYLQRIQYGVAAVVLLAVGTMMALQYLGPKNDDPRALALWVARFQRMTRFEFWPMWLFYAPVVPWIGWLMLRHRTITAPSAVNPSIPDGGLVGESKSHIMSLLEGSPEFIARTTLIAGGRQSERRCARLEPWMQREGLSYPVVLKPDVGQRGDGVRVVRHGEDARRYFARMMFPVVAQEYIPGPMEAGIFYLRHPEQERGQIFSITLKQFPTITGDGVRTVEELILDDPRARLIAPVYLKRHRRRRKHVLAPGETIRLVEAGNHCQGAIFKDGGALRTEALESAVDQIARTAPGIFFGRFDVRFGSLEDLRNGKNFHIIELNGASAEATHIWDEDMTLRGAYRVLFEQYAHLFAIGVANRRRGAKGITVREFITEWRRYQRRRRKHPETT